MKSYLDSEFHPAIEEYVCDYCDEILSQQERNIFEEVLVSDDELRSYTFAAEQGRRHLNFLKQLQNEID